MFSLLGSLAIWARALPSASSSTSRPRADSTWEKPLGSRPRPPGTGAWGRYPSVPCTRTLPVERTWGAGSPITTEMNDDLPVPFRPTRPAFSPAPTTNEASRTSVRSPISMVREDPTIMARARSGCRGWRARCGGRRGGGASGGTWESGRRHRRSRGGGITLRGRPPWQFRRRRTTPAPRPRGADDGRAGPKVVDPDRRLPGDLHAAARHHRRERGPPRHPAVPALELQRPAVGGGRLLPDTGCLPAHRRRGG